MHLWRLVNPKSAGWASRQRPRRDNSAEEIQSQPTGDLLLTQGVRSFCSSQAFN